ncbi:MAG: lysylphosphatidylglycerol synthase transmembrane domain-containing protein [Chloroflexia bacterium]
MAGRRAISFRSLLYIALAVLFLLAVVIRWDEAVHVSRVLARCSPGVLVLACLAQLGYYLTQAGLYQQISRSAGLSYRYRHLLPLVIVLPFMSVVAPSSGVSVIALLADDARQRGMRAERAIIAGVTYVAFCYWSLGMVFVFALVDLYQQGLLRSYQKWSGVVLGLGLVALLLILGLAGWAPAWLVDLFDGVRKAFRKVRARLGRPSARPFRSAETAVWQLHQAVQEIVRQPRRLALAALWGLLGQSASALVLYLVVRALGQQATGAVVLVGYSVSSVVTNISPTPQGLGFTEGAMVTVLRSLGLPRDGAWAVTLAYRGVAFWIPLVAGFFLVRSLPTFRARVPATAGKPESGHPHPSRSEGAASHETPEQPTP